MKRLEILVKKLFSGGREAVSIPEALCARHTMSSVGNSGPQHCLRRVEDLHPLSKAHPLAQKIEEQLTLNSNFLSTQQYFVSTCEWHRLKNTLSKV